MSEEKFGEAILTYSRFPAYIRDIIIEDIRTAFINRVKIAKKVLKLE